jgi:curli production assembly/transport component CsgG/holdfast attachment protein HfaB
MTSFRTRHGFKFRTFKTCATKPLAMFLPLALAATTLTGCVSTTPDSVTGTYATPIGGAPVISNETPYSRALECLASYGAGRPAPVIAVGQIADYTGKTESDGSGRKLTQGAALMAMSALSKAGVRLVERYDTSVAELELKYANNKLIGDNDPQDGYRKIFAGTIEGSNYYLVGGITELNFNIRSTGDDAYGADNKTNGVKATLEYKAYVMNIGLDLRLVDTKTLQVVDVISYQKQIVGRQISAGVFDILGTVIANADVGDSALEPVQLAVRAVVERAVLEMVSGLYHVGPSICRAGQDPLAGGTDGKSSVAVAAAPAPVTKPIAPVPPPPPPATKSSEPVTKPAAPAAPTRSAQTSAPQKAVKENSNEKARKEPYRWYSADDANGADTGLRGGLR